jgi:hypothetical protein
MSANFSVQCKKSNGNLHLRPKGDLDGSSAWELINLINEKYDDKGRVFIETQSLREVHPFGCSIFKCQLSTGSIPLKHLFFKGEKGFDMAPNGSRVLIVSKRRGCRCKGDCAICRCPAKRDKRNRDPIFTQRSPYGECCEKNAAS